MTEIDEKIKTKDKIVQPAPTAHPDARMHLTLADVWKDDGVRKVYPLVLDGRASRGRG